MSKLKMITPNGIVDASLVCSSCTLATSGGQPRWRDGKLACGTPMYDSSNHVCGFKCIHEVTVIDELALNSCCDNHIEISDLITYFAKTKSPSLDIIIDWLGALKLGASLLDAHTSWDKEPYSWNRILHAPTFDLIICCWEKGQGTLLHSHDGNLAAIRVLSGRLLSRICQLDKNGSKPPHPTDEQELLPNNISGINSNEAHQLVALEQSVSLHIYSKPLSFVTNYSSIMKEGNLQVVSFR